MSSLTPAPAASSLTLCVAQSGFHGTAPIGSLENTYASWGSSRPIAASSARIALRCSPSSEHVTGSIAR
jgi:hypothetical protein